MNGYLVYRITPVLDYGKKFFTCDCVHIDTDNIAELAWITDMYLVSRVLDLLDTIWFLLRKKSRQISCLHVFHHAYVPSLVYLTTRVLPIVPVAIAFPYVNCAVHVVMYAYYLASSFPTISIPSRIKQCITTLQMTQFVAMLLYHTTSYFVLERTCGKSYNFITYSSIMSAVIFFVMFYSFYRQNYVLKQRSRPGSRLTTSKTTTTTTSNIVRQNGKQHANKLL